MIVNFLRLISDVSSNCIIRIDWRGDGMGMVHSEKNYCVYIFTDSRVGDVGIREQRANCVGGAGGGDFDGQELIQGTT